MLPLTTDEQMPDRAALVAFVRKLQQDYVERGDQWENPTLDRFLEALASWIEDSPGWYRNFHQDMPEGGDWTFFARALGAATVYE